MALSTEVSSPNFRLYVTHVDGDGYFLRISGRLDQKDSVKIKSLFETAQENLDQGVGAVSSDYSKITKDLICAVKYDDGSYARAKVINATNVDNGLIEVKFIDYGKREHISPRCVSFLDKYDPLFLQLSDQSTDYYLSRVIKSSGMWEDTILMKLRSLLCNSEYLITINVGSAIPIISLQFKDKDLSTYLVTFGYLMEIPIQAQVVLYLQMTKSPSSNLQPNFSNANLEFSEYIKCFADQQFYEHYLTLMSQQLDLALQIKEDYPGSPPLVDDHLLDTKESHISINLNTPIHQPQHAITPKESNTFRHNLMKVNSRYKVFVSNAEEGPEIFTVQLVSRANRLQDMMDQLNRIPHVNLTEPPMIGSAVLGRMSADGMVYRAIIINVGLSHCQLFFVDFGDIEMVSYYDIFEIPKNYLKPNPFAMTLRLSGFQVLEKGFQLNEDFKQLVKGKVLTLKIVAPEESLMQYGELYLDENKNIFDLLIANMQDRMEFQKFRMLPIGVKHFVVVCYVESCKKFYVQLAGKAKEYNALMEAVQVACRRSRSPGELYSGASCCARFPEDGNWYRARVKEVKGGKVKVAYVDYGTEQEVDVSDLRAITPELMCLPAMAIKCALKGFENRLVVSKTSKRLEEIALDKTFSCQVAGGVLPSGAVLVKLVEEKPFRPRLTLPPGGMFRKKNKDSLPKRSAGVPPGCGLAETLLDYERGATSETNTLSEPKSTLKGKATTATQNCRTLTESSSSSDRTAAATARAADGPGPSQATGAIRKVTFARNSSS